jgi:RNA polymerase sigma factor (sigma-70 family)
MDRSDPSHRTEALDALIWEGSEEELRPREALLSAAGGLGLAALRELSDESLAVAIRRQFLLKPAFEELFVHRYTPYLARWFYRWGSDVHLAQDLTQQLFLRFYQRRLVSFQASDSFRAYLWKAAYHLWVEKVHRVRRPHSLDHVPEPPAGGAGPVGEAEARELEQRIEKALRRLPAEQQHVLRQTMNGRKAEEIATDLGLTKRAVFMHLFRARRRLEQALAAPARIVSGGKGE